MRERILEISKKKGLTHIGSCVSSVETIERIFDMKKPDEKFVLSNGHAGLALYVVMEKYGLVDAEEAISKDIHANSEFCDVSTGSLGMGLPIAVGMALADRSKNVYCMISDGEAMEGSIWEALRIAKELELWNLKVYCIANGWGAYRAIDTDWLEGALDKFFPVEMVRVNSDLPFAKGLSAHYKKWEQK